VDYLKLDGCYNNESGFYHDYPAMGTALQATGRDIVYSCSWPAYLGGNESAKPFDLMVDAGCNTWRNWIDIQCDWGVLDRIIEHWGQYSEELAATAGPGRWHDPDMLLIGAGCLSQAEERTQMAIWSVTASPLVMGNDLRNVSQASKAILLNKDAVAVDQDGLGKMGKRLQTASSSPATTFVDVTGTYVDSKGKYDVDAVSTARSGTQLWARELSGGAVAVALYNRAGGSPAGITLVAAGKYCSKGKAMGGGAGFGYSLGSCRDAAAADLDCTSGYFTYSASYNGQCKCALDACADRGSSGSYIIYKLAPDAPPVGPDITVHFADVGLQGPVTVYDIWAQEKVGEFQESYTAANVSFHGSAFLRLTGSSSITV